MKFRGKLTLAIALPLLVVNFGCRSNLTATASGQITRVAIDRDVKTSKRKNSSNKTKTKTTVSVETEVDYSYSVDGKTYQGYSEKDGDVQRDFQQGSSAVVCYNPSKPEESDVFPAGYKCAS